MNIDPLEMLSLTDIMTLAIQLLGLKNIGLVEFGDKIFNSYSLLGVIQTQGIQMECRLIWCVASLKSSGVHLGFTCAICISAQH